MNNNHNVQVGPGLLTYRAKKSLGQHFLKSPKALSQIVDAGDIQTGDTILEIGPGYGVLTERLLAKGAQVIAIEKDRTLIPILQEKFKNEINSGKLILINDDILRFDVSSNVYLTKYKLIANIPYYITGAIIEQFLSAQHQPSSMVLLMQREVAERIVAGSNVQVRPGLKRSILSIAVQVYGTPKIVGRVPPGAFVPPPTVESAVLLIKDINRNFFIDPINKCDEKVFFSVLKAIFGKKRKQIGGSLTEYMGDRARALELLATIDIDPKTRPETINKNEWKILTQHLSSIIN